MGIREEQKEKRRMEILDAGLDLFIRKGYAATKISDIAERAGMSTGLMFHYFSSKENLYEGLVKMGISGPMDIMATAGTDALEFFQRAVERIFHYLQTDPHTARMFVLMTQAFFNEAAPQSVKDLLKDFDIYTQTARLIEKGQADGTIREGDSSALGLAFWSAIAGIAEHMAMKVDQIPCPESEWLIDMIRRK
jgi:AcrR family transcriptional regulator